MSGASASIWPREHVVEYLFDALRQGGVGLAAAVNAITKAEQIVNDALGDYHYPESRLVSAPPEGQSYAEQPHGG
jgi:hypothetical protein